MSFNFFSSVASVFLFKIMGRRTLLIGNLLIMALCCGLMIVLTSEGNFTTQLIIILIYICSFELGPGPVCWVYMAEITNDKAMSVGTALNWVLTLFMSIIIPVMVDEISAAFAYGIFVLPCFLGFMFSIGVV